MLSNTQPNNTRNTILKTQLQTINNPLVHVNKWLAIFMCMWVSWPYINYKLGFLPFLLLMMAWLLTSDYKSYFRGFSLDLIMLITWTLTLIPYLLTGNFRYGPANEINILISFTLFFSGIFINHYYMYYNKNLILLGRISFFSIIFYVIASIQTYIGLQEYPLAARALATGNDPLEQTYLSLGIGGFGFVYSAVFINILILYFVLNKTKGVKKVYKYLCFATYLIITTMLVSASYAISLLFLCVGTLLVIAIQGRKSFIFNIVLAILFILLFPKELIGYFFMDVAQLFETNQVISSKFWDLAQGFVSESAGSQTSGRGQLYLTSLETFLRNPLFGIYGPFGNEFNAKVGGHSGWLDLMAYYGLFGALPLFMAIFLNFRKQLQFYSNHPYYYFLLTAQLLFIIFGFINPIIYIYQIGFILFVIAPSLPFLPYAFLRKKERGAVR